MTRINNLINGLNKLMVKNVTQPKNGRKISVNVNLKNHWNNMYVKKIIYGFLVYVLVVSVIKTFNNTTKNVVDSLILTYEDEILNDTTTIK